MIRHGLIVGDFYPLTYGYIYACNFARYFADKLTIVLTRFDNCDSSVVQEHARELSELFQGVEIKICDSARRDVVSWLKANISSVDFVFGFATVEAATIAEALNASFVPVSLEDCANFGTTLNVADRVNCRSRANDVNDVKRICIFGPESTGKSTLAKNLALHFQTQAVPEWARHMLNCKNNELVESDLILFARGQCASEDALALQSSKVLFCDTDPLTTEIWSKWIFGRCEAAISELAERRTYDLYLVADVDVPWVADPQRYLPEKRKEFFDYCTAELTRRKRSFIVIKGDWQQRFTKAENAVRRMLAGNV
jgi:HTH-type transcriptional repressor of NAD biosynthesis genes